MATTYSGWSDTWKPSGSSVNKQYRARLDTSYGYNDTTYWVTATVYVNINSTVEAYYWGRIAGSSQTTYTSSKVTTAFNGATTVKAISTTYYWARTHSAYTVSVTGSVMSDKKSWDGYWVATTQNFAVPAKTYHTISYNANSGTGTAPTQTKWYGENISLNDASEFSKDGFVFGHWNTANDNSGTSYDAGVTYSVNATGTRTMYAIWTVTDPPTFDSSGIEQDGVFESPTKNFSEIGTTISNIDIHTGRSVSRITLKWGSDTEVLTSGDFSGDVPLRLIPTSSGTNQLVVIVQDSDGAEGQIVVGDVTVIEPSWTYTAVYNTLIPNDTQFGYANMTVEAQKYVTGTGWTTWSEIADNYVATYDEQNNTWSFQITLNDEYVDVKNSETPNVHIRVSYNRQDFEEKDSRKPFFATTRNANFSTGISNTMFISGAETPNYSSRVWWSQINNPLYFPDTNYVEVGSNDTSVMGLTKVGDYLGVVKQSKTTDTAIFLIYPTSFEDNTTYAVKQLSSGIGAYGKYTFNVLGDETLFLSPNGVMAIAPSEDNDHKVQNRSYFIDGRLLKESNLSLAYSFVFDGKYYLAVNEHCYVLDGNQRNSWGNDRTNLVYECYYLDNVPATCFAKYDEDLYFSNDEQMCRFKRADNGDAYTDTTEDGSTPVFARWNTVLDDDGALNYYKTMQKKGNMITVFPNSPFKYTQVEITESEFNKNKTMYFTFNDELGYIRCVSDSVFDEDAIYYIREKTATKVFIRKDTNEPVEIKREFGETTEIPSEFFVNKKFKKYKRLQFILENNEAEPFGVDSIVKQYIIGNYAKR